MPTKPSMPCSLLPHRLQQFYPFFTCSEQMGLTTRHICLSVTSLKCWSLETYLHLNPWNFSGFRFLHAWKILIKFWERNFISKRDRCLIRQINGRALNNVCIVTVRVTAVREGGELRSPRAAESEGRKTGRQNECLKWKKKKKRLSALNKF